MNSFWVTAAWHVTASTTCAVVFIKCSRQGSLGDGLSTWVDRALVMLIVVNLVAVSLESIPRYEARYATIFALIEYVSLLVFTVELACGCGRRLSMDHTAISHTCGRDKNMR